MEKVKCEIWRKYKKGLPFLISCRMGKRLVFRGVADVAVLGS